MGNFTLLQLLDNTGGVIALSVLLLYAIFYYGCVLLRKYIQKLIKRIKSK